MSKYYPQPTPASNVDFSTYVSRELANISTAVNSADYLTMEVSYVAPTRVTVGEIRYADGSTWNPGSGAGLYVYDGAGWVLCSSGASGGTLTASTLTGCSLIQMTKTTSAPGSTAEGDIRFADGSGWNPGGGKGMYAYYSGAWNKL